MRVFSRFLVTTVCMTSLWTLGGCLSSSSAPSTPLLQDGSLLIARPLPAPAQPEKLSSLGFLPTYQAPSGNWLVIDTAKKTASLMEGDHVSLVTPLRDGNTLRPGRFQLLHKQRNPLWYAPSSYFEARRLPVPPEGDKARFRRGALGDFVLYLTNEIPIHSGPLWTEDVGGVALDDVSLSKMYYMLPVGANVEVR